MLTEPDSLLRIIDDARGLRLPEGHFIGGEFCGSRSGRSLQSEGSGKGEAFADFARCDDDDVADAVSSSRRALDTVWRRMAPAEHQLSFDPGLKDGLVHRCIDDPWRGSSRDCASRR